MNAKAARVESANKHLMSSVSEKVTAAILPIMQYYGIKKLETRTTTSCGFMKRLSYIEPFPDTPKEIVDAGLFIKDGLADILSSCGIVGIDITATPEEDAQMKAGYENFVSQFHAIQNGTAVTTTADSTAPGVEKKVCTGGTCKCQKKKAQKSQKSQKAQKSQKSAKSKKTEKTEKTEEKK